MERIKERLNDGLAACGNADLCSYSAAWEIFDLMIFLSGSAVFFSEADAPSWVARRCLQAMVVRHIRPC